jgi:serine/threonine protein kinase
MGEVYRASDARLSREVAVKVLPAGLAKRPEALARFKQEARVVATLSHPNILALFDFGEEQGLFYAVTELLAGETLQRELDGGAMPVRKALECAMQVAAGLAAAHEKGVVHRDLKPGNLFIPRAREAPWARRLIASVATRAVCSGSAGRGCAGRTAP